MKTPLLLAMACLFAGCASTTIYENGKPVFKTYADADSMTFKSRTTYFHAKNLNHSRPSKATGLAAGEIIGQVSGLAGTIGASVATGGVVIP